MQDILFVKIFLPLFCTFFFGFICAPLFQRFFLKYRLYKRVSRTDNTSAAFGQVHNEKEEASTPRVGGVIVWVSVFVCTALFYIFSHYSGLGYERLDFISRSQTFLPLFALFFGAILGLMDDFIQIFGRGAIAKDPVWLRYIKIGTLLLGATYMAYWFYDKLGVRTVHIPFGPELYIGFGVFFLFIFVSFAVFSSSVIDGMDGLSAGVLISVFLSFLIIASAHHQYDLAALAAAIIGALAAFLWYNIPPAKFYMGETGMIALTLTITVFAFLTNTVFFLPIIALPLVVTSGSVVIQLISKKYFGRKIFRLAPLHHHYEMLGYTRPAIVMHFWIFAIMSALFGTLLALVF